MGNENFTDTRKVLRIITESGKVRHVGYNREAHERNFTFSTTCQGQSTMSETEERLFSIRSLESEDRNWVAHFLDKNWGSTKIVSRGQSYYGHLLPGFAAEMNDAPEDAPPAGLITYNIEGKDCEILTLDSNQAGLGIGSALLDMVKVVAKEEGCKRLWLVTTNDNMEALRFYQRRNWELVAIHRNALIAARKMKPQIPLVGKNEIPLRDEIEMELKL
jgi:ribosomal protein S18 acetylase RimI-like enzyme